MKDAGLHPQSVRRATMSTLGSSALSKEYFQNGLELKIVGGLAETLNLSCAIDTSDSNCNENEGQDNGFATSGLQSTNGCGPGVHRATGRSDVTYPPQSSFLSLDSCATAEEQSKDSER